MPRLLTALTVGAALAVSSAHAGWFSKGVGSYGPYTGGHGYSYNTAYSYGFAFSAADTWRRDIFAYPGGINPYRPYGKPIQHRVFPTPDTPYIAVPGPDGLHTLIKPMPHNTDGMIPGHPLDPVAPPVLQAVPQPVPGAVTTATIRVNVPEGAEVWVEKDKLPAASGARTYQTPPLPLGKTQIISVRAKWNEGGRDVEQFRVVGVKAGETAKLTFGAEAP